jgi:hypothetical protein
MMAGWGALASQAQPTPLWHVRLAEMHESPQAFPAEQILQHAAKTIVNGASGFRSLAAAPSGMAQSPGTAITVRFGAPLSARSSLPAARSSLGPDD